MALNTRIRGAQINLGDEAIDVTADKLVFEDSDGVFKKESVNDLVTALAGDGVKNVSSQFAVEPNDIAGEGLEDDGSDNLRVKLDGATIARSGDGIKVADDSIDDTQLNAGAGTPGQVLKLGSGGTIAWANEASVAEDYLQEAEIKLEHKLGSDVDSADTITLASAPVANSVQVYLNGLLQEEGSGKDYILSGSDVTFVTTPEASDIILIHYIAT
jgi:hypothetical protein